MRNLFYSTPSGRPGDSLHPYVGSKSQKRLMICVGGIHNLTRSYISKPESICETGKSCRVRLLDFVEAKSLAGVLQSLLLGWEKERMEVVKLDNHHRSIAYSLENKTYIGST